MNNDIYASAKAKDFNSIELLLSSTYSFVGKKFCLYINGNYYKDIVPSKRSSFQGVYHFEFFLNEEIQLGNLYSIDINDIHRLVIVEVSPLAKLKKFDEMYYYSGSDLGPTYSKEATSFALWAPLSDRVILKIAKDGSEEFALHEMKRSDRGVYRLTLTGDYDKAKYVYIVHNFGYLVEAADPYAKSSFANGKYSAVVNLSRLDSIEENVDKLPFFRSNCHAIIYEAHVRDMTIQNYTNIENKGKFLGMIERGRTTKKGYPAGFDYLKSLGFTHLQLLPCHDYGSVDELGKGNIYNWGYDPIHYFVLEGSYSTNPDDPYARMIEFKKLVSEFHKEGIRINLDVVYNHVYDGFKSIFEKIVPNYYFRTNNEDRLTNCSGCGCDVASERPMVRKMILDSIGFLVDTYSIDGLRFDLMGIMDVPTMKEIENLVLSKKSDFMLYGEGWNMGSKTMDNSPLATMDNAALLPRYAFFNDRYRNIAKGIGMDTHLAENGFLFANRDFLHGFKFVYMGSCVNVTYPKIFTKASQSLNYVECHDNGTIFDVIDRSLNESKEDKINRLNLINKTLALSFGIPFYHMGQEIGQSKKYLTNTYNAGDEYNQFDYRLLEERYESVEKFRLHMIARKELSFLRIDEPETIEKMVSYLDFEDGLLIDFNGEYLHKYDSFKIFINPYKKVMYYNLDGDYTIYYPNLEENNKLMVHNVMVAPLTTYIVYK